MNLRLRVDKIEEGFLREAERAAILRVLWVNRGNAEDAAAQLGIGKSTMYRKIVEHGITDEERY